MKKYKLFIILLLLPVLLMTLFACGGDNTLKEPIISVNAEGYLVVDGVETKYKVDSGDLSAYELYKKNNPSYVGDENQWLKELIAGTVTLPSDESYTYDLIASGERNADLSVLNTGLGQSGGSSYQTTNAVFTAKEEIIMPLTSESNWSITLGAQLFSSNGSGGGQFLNSLPFAESGRVYFGSNYQNNRVFMGVCFEGTYFNYSWTVDRQVLTSQSSYEIAFDGKVITLAIDGGDAKGFSHLVIGQPSSGAAIAKNDWADATAELITKVRSISGQQFFSLNAIGASTHKLTAQITDLTITTSAIGEYRKLSKHPLSNKMIYYLGSSITDGLGKKSFPERINAITNNGYVKEAVSGTTLVTSSPNSYVDRLVSPQTVLRFDTDQQVDALFVQLSTNDFGQGKPVGSVSDYDRDNYDLESFDTTTIIGALEYIFAYVTDMSPHTKVFVWAGPMTGDFDANGRANYISTIDTIKVQLADKWALEVIDMYNMNYIKVPSYLADSIHMNDDGYGGLFTPNMICSMLDAFSEKA